MDLGVGLKFNDWCSYKEATGRRRSAAARDTAATRVGRGRKLPRSPWRDCGPADPDPRLLASTESQPAGGSPGKRAWQGGAGLQQRANAVSGSPTMSL